jgi:hypothetical protein
MKDCIRALSKVTAVVLAAVAGCQQPNSTGVEQAAPPLPLESNIVNVRTFFNEGSWISFNSDAPDDPEGLRLTVFLESGLTGKGVRGDGTLMVEMHRLRVDERSGRHSREKVFDWSFPPEEAILYMPKRESRYGWPYALRLNWKNTDVYGDDIQIVVKFKFRNGAVISGSPITMHVPARKNYTDLTPNSSAGT